MNYSKKNFYVSFILIIFIILVLFFYYNKYSIKNNNTNIKNYLITKVKLNPKDVLIKKQLDIKNKKIVVLAYNNNILQYALFEKGLNGKLHYIYWAASDNYNYSSRSFLLNIKSTNYLISVGYNPKSKSYAVTVLQSPSTNKTLQEEFKVTGELYFIKYKIMDDKYSDYNVLSYDLLDVKSTEPTKK